MDRIESFNKFIDFEIESFNKSLLHKKPINLYAPIKYTLELGGKRLRPLLALLSCDLFDGSIQDVLKPALGLEIFHNFTLLHDDIMDKAPLRRNQPTVHKKWNTDIAILSGDTMFVQSFQYVMQSPEFCLKEVLEIFTKTAIEVCEGQQMDMDFETQSQVSIAQYIKMIELKTSVLLAGSAKIGAVVSGARPEDAQHIYEFGKNLGIAFQLQDDILDVFGSKNLVGKQTGGDIVSNKKTYLLLKTLNIADRYKKEELELWMHTKQVDPNLKIEAVKAIYEYFDVKNLAREELLGFYNKSLAHLEKIPCNKAKKEALTAFTQNLMDREN